MAEAAKVENKGLIVGQNVAGMAVSPPPALNPPALPERDPYQGIAAKAFPAKAQEILQGAIDPADVEIRPDGIVYLPEILYRRVLNRAFGAGGWALMPREKLTMQDGIMYQRWQLMVDGRYASEAVGEQEYFANNPNMTFASAAEATKSNAMMRCCKDLGISSELWTPSYIENWKKQYAVKVYRQKAMKTPYQWRRKDREPFYDEAPAKAQFVAASGAVSAPREPLVVPDAPPTPVHGEPQRKPKAAVAPPPTPPQAAVAKHPAQKPTASGAPAQPPKPHLNWRGIILDVAERKGTTNNKPWTMWRINGDEFSAVTFDAKVSEAAFDYKTALAVVDIAYEQGARGPVIIGIEKAGGEEIQATADAEVEQDGVPQSVIDAEEGR